MSDDPDPGQRSSSATATEAAESGHVIDILFPVDKFEDNETRVLAARLRMAAETALDMAATGPGALTLLLSDDDEVRVLNRRFRGADKPTNVLSFPAEAKIGRAHV
jgi:ssRNA-specific RNase YbeY (16S rRNA maturation enzyme)